MKTRVIGIINTKGGVGKTTTSVALSITLAGYGYKVLLIDCDPQGQSSYIVAGQRNNDLYKLLIENAPVARLAMPTGRKGLDIIVGGASTEQATNILTGQRMRESVLSRALNTARGDYEFVILDSPPSINTMAENILVASDEYVIPCVASTLALDGVTRIISLAQEMRQLWTSPKSISAILPVMYDVRTNEDRRNLVQLREGFGQGVAAPIPMDIKVREAESFNQSIVEYAPESRAGIAYAALGLRMRANNEGLIIDG